MIRLAIAITPATGPNTNPIMVKMERIQPAKNRLIPNSARMAGSTGGGFPHLKGRHHTSPQQIAARQPMVFSP